MKKLKILLLILWCLLIFSFSSENASDSSKTSHNFSNSIISIFEKVTNVDIDNEKVINNTMGLVRKCAHFSLYLVLGVLSINLFKDYRKNKLIRLSILFCFLYSCSDEFHQLFLEGRSAQLSDIFIDTLGAFTGVIIYLLIYSLIKKKLIKNILISI